MTNLLNRAKTTWPGLCKKDLEIALWSLTTYPTGRDDDIIAALSDAYEKSDGNLLQAQQQADEKLVKQQITQ
jgi:hypothetical protein